ncbi:MAG: hypothetical protein WD875_04565 [Pirellulales bacterium]
MALSLAFYLYVQSGRVRRQRDLLKRVVAEDAALSKSLADYLKPPPRGGNSWKRSEAQWKRRTEAHERKQRENREKWRDHLRSNVATLRNSGLSRGKITDDQWYLHQRMVREDDRSGRWTDGNWRDLIEEFDEDVAQAFRDGAVGFWRTYTPKLRSEGAPANETPFAVIFGLTGLHIEAAETANWPATLNTADVALACRYASCELNGFPVWFPALFNAHPSVVGDFLLSEIRSELATETPDGQSHYILSDVVSSGQWAWNQLAPEDYDALAAKEPANLSNLNDLLAIVQGGSVADLELARLAAKKCKARISMDHKALWFAVWVGVDPSIAIPALAVHVDKIAKPKTRTDFAMRFITNLLGGRRGVRSGVRTAYRAPNHLKSLYLLMHRHISTTDDIHRAGGGAYSPGLRDDAQDTRDGLAELIRNIPGKEAFVALSDIAIAHPEESYRPRFALLAKTKAENDAEISAWSPQQVHDFIYGLECTPANHRELAELARLRLLDLKDDLEHGDSSIAGILKDVSQETEIRKFIGGVLRDKAAGRYIVPQEEELADAKRPDFRIHGAGFDGPVPVELKLADNWSGTELLERLENQLCGDYLRDNRSNRGFFILVYRGEKKEWTISTRRVAFDGLVGALETHWANIAVKYTGIEEIGVIGIDLTKRRR